MSESTVEIRPDLKAELENLAQQTHRDKVELANEALTEYLQREKANLARIREGLEQARLGEFVADEEVHAFFARRGTRGA